MMSYNTRGQDLTFVNNSVEEGENRESFLLDAVDWTSGCSKGLWAYWCLEGFVPKGS